MPRVRVRITTRRVAGRPPQRPRAVADVAQHAFDGQSRAHVAHPLLDLLDAFDLEARRAQRGVRRQATLLVGRGPRLQIGAQLVVEIALGVPAPAERPEPRDHDAQEGHGYDVGSSTRLIAVTTLCQVAFCAERCLRPARVSR